MSERKHLREELVVPYLDGRLGVEERAEVERHLEACAECQARVSGVRGVLEVLSQWEAAEPSEGFSRAVETRLEAEAQAEAARQARWVVRLRPAHAGVLAAAVAVLLVVALLPTTVERVEPPAPAPTARPTERAQPMPTPSAEADREADSGELAALEPALLEDYELLRDFDVLFDREPATGKPGTE